MKIKYKGKIYEAVRWADDTIRSKSGKVFLGFSEKYLVEGAEKVEDDTKV